MARYIPRQWGLQCSCGGLAFKTRRKLVYEDDYSVCAACDQPGHVSVTDDYEDDAVASWHLVSECDPKTCSTAQRAAARTPKSPEAA